MARFGGPCLLVAALALLAATSVAQKASRFKPCKRSLPTAKLNECVRDSIQQSLPYLAAGLPEYGMLPLDPLRVELLRIPRNEGKVSVDLTFKNLDIRGFREAIIKSVNMNVDKYSLTSKIEINGPIILDGDYKIKGQVLILPIEGSGRCNITLVNPRGEIVELLGKPVVKNGKTYAQITSMKFVVTHVERVYYNLENLFNGNKELGDNMNMVLNDSWEEVYQDMVGPIQEALGEAIRASLSMLVNKAPYNKIFP